ncbi:MAG: hypothetical protein JOY64_03220 [Alphaproteobacteria bacterium]|nr:hypothetical protein [Alphaproteobacteria bacterium]
MASLLASVILLGEGMVYIPPGHLDLVESLKGAAAPRRKRISARCFDEDARPEQRIIEALCTTRQNRMV